MKSKQFEKFTLLASLYISQYIPVMFLYQALPVFLRQQGASLESVALINLIAFPLMLKFIWAPFIDSFSIAKWGHYRFWIICLQVTVAILTAVCAFADITQNITITMALLCGMILFSSTQDIATDALAVNLLKPEERGAGNAIQTGGSYLGAIIGGGGVLILLEKFGWHISLLVMSAMMLLSLIPILGYQENQKVNSPTSLSPTFYLQTFIKFCRRPGIAVWLLVIILATAGAGMTTTMFQPLLVDVGLSLSDIALLRGVVSYSVSIVGALIGGLLITRWGRKKSLILFCVLNAIATAAHILPGIGMRNLTTLYVVSIGFSLVFSMLTTCLYTIMMDKTTEALAATEYSFQISILYIGGIIPGLFSGVIAKAIGYAGLFAVAAVICLLPILIISNTVEKVN
jgi:MFS family permease